jgi:tRNA(Ile)-lysidine synthase
MSIVLQELQKNTPARASILLAVSGGADSMALLDGYARLGRIQIEVAHLDHRLRVESSRDAEFVEQACQQRGITFHKKALTPPESGNIEKWGREQRYQFFTEVREQRNLSYVATAHTANDCAETLLMRLVSNKDLRGIEPIDEKRCCFRPLIAVFRTDIEEYLQEHQVGYIHDSTNDNTEYLRSRVRHKVIPFLNENFEGDLQRILACRAEVVRNDLQVLDQIVLERLAVLAKHQWGVKGWLRELREILEASEDGLRWRLVEQALLSPLGYRVGWKKAQEVNDMILGTTAAVQLPGGVSVKRSSGGICLLKTGG